MGDNGPQDLPPPEPNTVEAAVAGMAPAAAATTAPETSRRWKTFADVVAFTLGINVWISLVILPAIFVGALHGWRIPFELLPFALLCIGLSRRSEGILLFIFPGSTLIPIATSTAMAEQHVYGPIRFALVALGVIAYLFGVSFFTTFHEPPAPRSVRPLSSAAAGPATRWVRRERVYWMLVVLSVVFPAVLLGWVNYDEGIADYLAENYTSRVALMTTALTVGAIVLWLLLFHHVFLGVLRPHRTGDRDLVAALAQARADAKVGKPRPRFYIAVALALAAMVVLVLLHRKG